MRKKLEEYFYDVIIIGSGPAGLMAASRLSREKKIKIAVISPYNKYQWYYDVKGTAYEDLIRFNLGGCIESSQNNFGMYSRKEKKVFCYNKKKTYIINFPKLLKILKKRAVNSKFINAEIVDGYRVPGGIVVIDTNKQEYKGKIIIDASGNSFVMAHILGLEIPKATYHCISAIFRKCKFKNTNEMSLYMNPEFCNSSVWVYPITKTRCQIGLGEISVGKTVSRGFLEVSLLRAVKKMDWFRDVLANCELEPNTTVFGHKPVIEPVEKLYGDNLIFAGDSGGQGTALVGEGVRPALCGGYFAAEASIRAFKLNKFNADTLKLAEELWWRKLGRHEIWYIILRHFVVKNFNSEDWDEVIKRLKSISNKRFWTIISSGMNRNDLFKLFDVKIAKNILAADFKGLLKKMDVFNKRHITSEIT